MKKVVPFERSGGYWHQRAAINRREGRLIDALALFRRAAEREPDNLGYRMDVAETLCEMGCYMESNRVLASMLLLPDAPDDCYFGLSCNYFGMGELDRAYRAMVRFLSADPKAVDRTEVNAMLKDIILMRALGEMKNRRAVRLSRLLMNANERLHAGDARAAEALTRRVLKLSSGHERARVMLSKALMAQGRVSSAQREMDRALKGHAVESQTLTAAVEVYLAAGDRDAAARALNKLARRKAEGANVALHLKAACAMGDDERVRHLLPRALREAPYDRALLHRCAVNRVREGRPVEQAIGFWTRILSIEPTDPVARYYLSAATHGTLGAPMSYDYRLPDAECAQRHEQLKEAQWLPDEALLSVWTRQRDFQALCRWAVRSGEKQLALLAKALLHRIDEPGATALLSEGILEPDSAPSNLAMRWPIGQKSYATMTVSGQLAGIHVPIASKKAIKLAIVAARMLSGDLAASIVHTMLSYLARKGPHSAASDPSSWAAALIVAATADRKHPICARDAARLLGCPERRVRRLARGLKRTSREPKEVKT